MALIVCPECGKNFSDRAPACPECGCPTSEIIGQSSNVNAGQVSIANIAFDDGRYDEAYQLFAQIYAQNQNDPHVMVRLGLAAAAKDYFDNGIPNSTKDLIAKALAAAKSSAASQGELVSLITPYVKDVKKVIDDTDTVIIKGVSTALNQTAPTRSTGAMVADALFSPIASANRNLYEDNRTAQNNLQIIQKAVSNKQIIRRTLDTFGSYILKLVVDTLDAPLPENDPLYKELGTFAANAEDAKAYERISNSAKPQENVYGLCYGEEKVLLSIHGSAYLMVGNSAKNRGGVSFSLDNGEIIISNYKITYNAYKAKARFVQPLDDLIRVKLGDLREGSVSGTWIEFVFPNHNRVLITPKTVGNQGIYVAALNEQLKMPNR